MATSRWDRPAAGWLVGALMVAVGQLMLPFVDHETVWSLDLGGLPRPDGGASLVHSLVAGFARAWVTPGALLASLLVLVVVGWQSTAGSRAGFRH